MEPLSAHGLPRLSWIDTLYSSTYLSILLFTTLDKLFPHSFSLSSLPHAILHSNPLLLHLMGFLLQTELNSHREQRACFVSGLPISRHYHGCP